ncbi:hypothetical protein [Mycolicibacterium litorale]|uniref:hypothetical protein n=1 Tax=Mycolicibacterium litorale TaxID=758802 RepID=UPI00399F35AF
MANRVLAWLGVGLLTGWLASVLAFGSAVAWADTGTETTSGETSTAEPAEDEPAPAETTPPEDADEPEQPEDDVPDEELPEELPAELPEDEPPAEDPPAEEPADEPVEEPVETEVVETPEPETPAAEETPVEEVPPHDDPAVEEAAARVEDVDAEVATVFATDDATVEEPTHREETRAVAAAAPLTPQGPTLVNIVGTLFFNVFDAVVKWFEGPPAVPPNTAVRVERRPLEIDCGDGYTVDADWYFPTETEPDKIIFFAHGGFARAGLYNVTAAELAERNNAIVVAPSVTSNPFACDGCAQGLDPMHAAVARLFLGDREALTASAHAAGWEGDLPERFVIAGHSGGGQLAAGAAGYYTQYASDADDRDLAGVLLLDTSPVGGALERALGKIPDDIAVYTISAAPGPLNSYGGADEVLAAERDGFVGVRLIGGTHTDSWRWTNTVAQFFVGLATGGPAQPQNVEAVQVLAQGWITDWFRTDPATPKVGYYGERGTVIDIPTAAGTAQAYVAPGPAAQMTILDRVLEAAVDSMALLQAFSGNCAVDPGTYQPSNQHLAVKNSTDKIVSSLDGRRLTGQSVGQHVCTD